MFNFRTEHDKVYVSRTDVHNPLASYSRFGFELDDADWPSLEHYYQGMKFEDADIQEQVRTAPHPAAAEKLAKKHRRKIRSDWKKLKQTYMTRGAYIKCRTHPEVAEALLKTADLTIIENSQFDYYWGCGRDGRGDNTYGKVLMEVRDKIKTEMTS
jgi:hypothetical protein